MTGCYLPGSDLGHALRFVQSLHADVVILIFGSFGMHLPGNDGTGSMHGADMSGGLFQTYRIDIRALKPELAGLRLCGTVFGTKLGTEGFLCFFFCCFTG